MLEIYTAVLTSDGRTGIYVGGWYKGREDFQKVVFQDGSMWQFREKELRPARVAVGFDYNSRTFRRNADPVWKKVLQRWMWGQAVIIAMGAIETDNERQPCQGPGFVAPLDDYGIWNAISSTWGQLGGIYDPKAMRTAWLLLFHTVLPRDEELDAAVEAGAEDRHHRVEQLQRQRDVAAGVPVQARLFD